ncbi:unnamed protein product [Nezara viridula]|uniref:Uncharacterized protein n=1 Tax=Nezara viridula TaxID=85310 RepID=A0A9P0H2W2_NEZVI|nr:unnamed protein product [Nezara viridula]
MGCGGVGVGGGGCGVWVGGGGGGGVWVGWWGWGWGLVGRGGLGWYCGEEQSQSPLHPQNGSSLLLPGLSISNDQAQQASPTSEELVEAYPALLDNSGLLYLSRPSWSSTVSVLIAPECSTRLSSLRQNSP